MFFVFLLQQKSETYPAGTVASLLEDVSLNNLIFTLFLPQAQPNWIEGFRLQSINFQGFDFDFFPYHSTVALVEVVVLMGSETLTQSQVFRKL